MKHEPLEVPDTPEPPREQHNVAALSAVAFLLAIVVAIALSALAFSLAFSVQAQP